MSMSFRLRKHTVVLEGIKSGTIDILIGNKGLKYDFVRRQGWLLQLMAMD